MSYDRGEYYAGCRCTNGKIHPDCSQHRPVTWDDMEARVKVIAFLKKREEEK